jgi:hypothetical protein
MSTENDVPLGEGARGYYEQKFGERIRQVSKGSKQPRDTGSSSRTKGSAGCGVVFFVFILIRLIASFSRSNSHTPTYQYNPPAPIPIQKQLPNKQVKPNFPKPQNPFGNEQDDVKMWK